jgi:hypothetical protein
MLAENKDIQDIKKRRFLQSAIASALVVGPNTTSAATKADEAQACSAVNVIIPTDYAPALDAKAQYRLIRAILSFLEDHYRGKSVPVWGRKFEEIDFEPRLISIVYWIAQGVQRFRDIYPLDPIWVVAQIMKESYFYEFAISRSLGVGICQFLRPTAHEYGMICAGDAQEHGHPPYRFSEFAVEIEKYYERIQEKKGYQKSHRPDGLSLEECLEIIAAADCSEQRQRAQENINYNKAIKGLDTRILESKERYRKFIEANVEDKNIFRDTDFLTNFDERLTYEKSILSMIRMLSRHLRARNGNILAAAAGYQAGLSHTKDEMMYQPYGKIPAIQSTVDYLSHIIVIHHELNQRIEKS